MADPLTFPQQFLQELTYINALFVQNFQVDSCCSYLYYHSFAARIFSQDLQPVINAMLWLAQASAILAIRLAQVGAVATAVSVPTPIFKFTLSTIFAASFYE